MKTKKIFSLDINEDESRLSILMKGVIPKGMIGQELESMGDSDMPEGLSASDRWREAAHAVFNNAFPVIVAEEKITPLGSPEIQFTGGTENEDISFQLSFFVIPDITLPPYEQLLQGVKKPEEPKPATEKDVDAFILDMRKRLYRQDNPEKEVPEDESEIPELTDERVKKMTRQHADFKSFRDSLFERLTKEKKLAARTMFRRAIVDAILSKIQVVVPEIIVREDVKTQREEFEKRAKALKTSVEEYLQSQNRTEEEFQKSLEEDAVKKATLQLILTTIGTRENIQGDREMVERELERFKRRTENKFSDQRAQAYVEALLTNEAVMQFLEEKVGT